MNSANRGSVKDYYTVRRKDHDVFIRLQDPQEDRYQDITGIRPRSAVLKENVGFIEQQNGLLTICAK